ncbi:MAG: hypothetical protein ACM3TT_06385 [Syntrophothermus sp.]
MKRRLNIEVLIKSFVLFLALILPMASPVLADSRKELIGERTEYTKKFDNGDRTITFQVSSSPLHYQDDAGTWQDIDLDVTNIGEPDYELGVLKNKFKTRFGRHANQPTRFDFKGAWVQFKPEGSKNVPGVAAGSTVTYQGAWEGADLRYKVGAEELKEEIVLQAPGAVTRFRFHFVAHGVSARQEADGSIGFYLADGIKSFTMPAPFMYDSAQQPVSSDAVKYELTQQGNGFYLDIAPDQAWLAAPERVYPVIVDPTISVNTAGGNVGRATFNVAYGQTVSWYCNVPIFLIVNDTGLNVFQDRDKL